MLSGSLQAVQDTIHSLMDKMNEFYQRNHEQSIIKILIPQNFVTKLIGAGGSMIKDIAAKSGGARIKILSEKEIDRDCDETVAAIEGSLASKQDAACMIAERIYMFKKGEPFRERVKRDPARDIEVDTERGRIREKDYYLLQKIRDSDIEPGEIERANIEPMMPVIPNIEPEKLRHEESKRSHGDYQEIKHSSSDKERKSSHSHSKKNDIKESYSPEAHQLPDPENGLKLSYSERNEDKFQQTINSSYLDRKDCTKNSSYQENGITKIAFNVVVPSYLVSLLIGRNGENIKSIVNRSGCSISFHKEDDNKINTEEGIPGRLCTLIGTPQIVSEGFKLIMDNILRLETTLNGVRNIDKKK